MKKDSHSRAGFTLMELLAVLVIMMMMMGMLIASFHGIGQGDRLRGGVETVRNTLALARQYAVSHSADVTVEFIQGTNVTDNGSWDIYAYLKGTNVLIRERTYLPNGVDFDSAVPPPNQIVFRPNGRINWSGGGDPEIRLVEQNSVAGDPVVIRVYTITGLVNVEL